MLSVKQGGISTIFWFFGMTRPGIEPQSPGPLANTLTTTPIDRKYSLKLILNKDENLTTFFFFIPILNYRKFLLGNVIEQKGEKSLI